MNPSSADVCRHLGSEWTNSSNVNTTDNIDKFDPYYSFAGSIRTTPVPQTYHSRLPYKNRLAAVVDDTDRTYNEQNYNSNPHKTTDSEIKNSQKDHVVPTSRVSSKYSASFANPNSEKTLNSNKKI